MAGFRDRVCSGDMKALEDRVLRAVYALGFRTFKRYLSERTAREDGSTWKLTDMADELELPHAIFIRYHARWVEANAPRRILK